MKLKCPVCAQSLTTKIVGGIKLDVCEGGCAGIFFDHRELKKFDEPHEEAGTELLEIKRNPTQKINHVPRNCPLCLNIVMMRQFFSVKRSVEVDLCAKCGGYWLDAGELAAIRSEFPTEADRIKAFHQVFDELFQADLAEAKLESEKKLESARLVARIFRFICPSYYIPGKQNGAAW
jgi:Zn-finger nucleic acid-binding protein